MRQHRLTVNKNTIYILWTGLHVSLLSKLTLLCLHTSTRGYYLQQINHLLIPSMPHNHHHHHHFIVSDVNDNDCYLKQNI